jgi:hypothetical protein
MATIVMAEEEVMVLILDILLVLAITKEKIVHTREF